MVLWGRVFRVPRCKRASIGGPLQALPWAPHILSVRLAQPRGDHQTRNATQPACLYPLWQLVAHPLHNTATRRNLSQARPDLLYTPCTYQHLRTC